MMDQKIKDKIAKLLSLATSPNANEAQSAMAKARKLMDEYNLTELSVMYTFDTQDLPTKKWKQLIFNKVYMHNNCFVIAYSREKSYHCYGRETNLYLASELYKYIVQSAERIARCVCENAQEKRAYLDGFAESICERLKTEPAWAIDAQERKSAEKYAVADHHESWVTGRAVTLNPSQYGRNAGNSLSLHKQAGGSNQLRISN